MMDTFGAHASIVEVILRQIIELWEQRNKDLHGRTDKEAEKLRKEKLIEKARELDSLREDVQPIDRWLFHNNFEQFITRSSSDQILHWISFNKRAIKNSIK